MRIVRRADQRVVPWKNGRGASVEVAVHPEGAGIEDFGWRITTTSVDEDGPFSRFPGVERFIAVTRGRGMDLVLPDGVLVVTPGRLVRFDGDVPVHARLHDGPVGDVNLMVRRTVWGADAAIVPVSGRLEAVDGVVLVLEGEVGPLGPGDVAFVDGPIAWDGDGVVLTARLSARTTPKR